MTKMPLDIKPHRGVGPFLLQDPINKVLSLIKANGENYVHADIVLGEQPVDPLYLIIPKEGIKLRFNGITQRLELIELLFNQSQSRSEYSFKGNLVLSTKNKQHALFANPTYAYVNEIFGTSKVPKLIDSNKVILLPHEGISFLFSSATPLSSSNEMAEAPLYKIVLYEDNTLADSLNKDNLKFHSPAALIRYEVDKPEKGLSIQNFTHRLYNNDIGDFIWMQDPPVVLSFNDSLEEILHKMKNPNYVYEKGATASSVSTEGSAFFSKDFFLNYYGLGMDILIDGSSKRQKAKKIILHCNSPFESKFGIYSRSNFIIELNRHFLKANIDTTSSNSYRKLSDEYVTEHSNNSNSFQIDTELTLPLHSIEQAHSFSFLIQPELEDDKKYTKQKVSSKRKERGNTKPKPLEKGSKSNGSSFDRSLSLSLNTSDQSQSIIILPWANFGDVIAKVPTGAYSVYQRHDTKINVVYKYYLFEGIIFEVLDNNTIVSVVIYTKEQ